MTLKGVNVSDTDLGWKTLFNTLCDRTSMNRIFSSNHTLETLGFVEGMDPDVGTLLHLNSNVNKFQVACLKILRFHLRDGITDIQSIVDGSLAISPHIVVWLGSDREF